MSAPANEVMSQQTNDDASSAPQVGLEGTGAEKSNASASTTGEDPLGHVYEQCFLLCVPSLSFLLQCVWVFKLHAFVFVWIVLEYIGHFQTHCDVPLKLYCHVAGPLQVYHWFLRHHLLRSCGVSQPVDDHGQPLPVDEIEYVPKQVKAWEFLLMAFNSAWTVAGVYWVSMSGRIVSELPACSDVAPGFVMALRVHIVIDLCLGIERRFFRPARTQKGAPPGTMKRNAEVILMGHEALSSNPSCPVCHKDFSSKNAIVLTKRCRHVLHQDCWESWLQDNMQCPKCRMGLAEDVDVV